MRQLLIIILIILNYTVYGQTVDSSNVCIIKTNIAALNDYPFPTLQFSIEKSVTRHLSIEPEAGLQIFGFHNIDSIPIKAKGFKINLELKYYFLTDLDKNSKLKNSGIYIGLRPFYKQNQFAREVTYYPKSDSLNSKSDAFGVKKNQIGANCIFGFQQFFFHRKLAVDFHIGIGGKYLTVENYYRNYNPSVDRIAGTDLVPYFSGLDMSENSGLKVDLTCGLKIGFKI